MNRLQNRYRRLLTLYPGSYRRERGEEMLATLMESATSEGRSRPTIRETVELCRGALRVRVRANAVDPRGDILQGGWWGAALWLVYVTLLAGMHPLRGLLILGAIVLALAGHKIVAIIIAIALAAPIFGTLATASFNGYGAFKFAVPLLVVAAVSPRTVGLPRAAAYTAIGVAGLAISLDRVPGWYDTSRLGVALIAGLLMIWALVAFVGSGRVLAPIVAAALIGAGNGAVSLLYHGGDPYVWATVGALAVLVARLARKHTAKDIEASIQIEHT